MQCDGISSAWHDHTIYMIDQDGGFRSNICEYMSPVGSQTKGMRVKKMSRYVGCPIRPDNCGWRCMASSERLCECTLLTISHVFAIRRSRVRGIILSLLRPGASALCYSSSSQTWTHSKSRIRLWCLCKHISIGPR